MQLICKLLSCYCKQVWYFTGNCSSINKSQCENNNGDMSSVLPTWAIIGIVVVVVIIVLAIIICIICCTIKYRNKIKNIICHAIRNRNKIQKEMEMKLTQQN